MTQPGNLVTNRPLNPDGSPLVSNLPEGHLVYRSIIRTDGSAIVKLAKEDEITLIIDDCGWFPSLTEAIEATELACELHGGNVLNIFKDTKKLFPHLRGAMLREKPVVMALGSQYQEIMPKGNEAKSRLEISFQGTKKLAIINATQALKLANMFGPETEDWAGCRVVLYAEDGHAFGNTYCAVRIADMTDQDERMKFGQFLEKKRLPKVSEDLVEDIVGGMENDLVIDQIPAEAE
jgi:hypothetical protein